MRRRRTPRPEPVSGLSPDALRPAPADDRNADYATRKARFDTWIEEREAWIARREEYAAEHGWPGGDHARALEEDEAHPIPDMPFDADIEIANGNL